jgi:hypothetical protein
VLNDGVDSPFVSPVSFDTSEANATIKGQVLASGVGVIGSVLGLYLNADPSNLPPTPTMVAYTGADGGYYFSLPVAERTDAYTIVLTPPPGYEPAGPLMVSGTHSPSATTQADFELNPPTSIVGTVTDPSAATTAGGQAPIAGATRDDAAPSSTVLAPGPKQSGRAWLGVCAGTAADPDGYHDLARISVVVQDQTTGQYWNGLAFIPSATPVSLTAQGTSNWSLPLPASALIGGHTYAVTSVASDREGATQAIPATMTFTYPAPTIIPTPSPSPTPTPAPSPTPASLVATMTTITVSTPASVPGQTIAITVTVTPASGSSVVPGGAVALSDGPTVLAVQPLNGSSTTFEISTLTTGSHALAATYLGNAQTLPSTSLPIAVTVTDAVEEASATGGPNTLAISGTAAHEIITLVGRHGGRQIQVIRRGKHGRLLGHPTTYESATLDRIDLYLGSGDVVRMVGRITDQVWTVRNGVERLIHPGGTMNTRAKSSQ